MKKVIALVLCRGKSKGIKNKNLVNFFGKPLMYWTIKQLKDCKIIKEIYVSSDSKKILNYAEKLKVSIIINCSYNIVFNPFFSNKIIIT